MKHGKLATRTWELGDHKMSVNLICCKVNSRTRAFELEFPVAASWGHKQMQATLGFFILFLQIKKLMFFFLCEGRAV